MQKIFKTKSLSKHVTEYDLKNNPKSVRFLSFESAIELFKEHYGLLKLKDQPDGYQIVEDGIIIIQKL